MYPDTYSATLTAHPEPDNAFSFWLTELLGEDPNNEKASYFMRRLIGSTPLQISARESIEMQRMRITEYELAVFAADALRKNGSTRHAIDLILWAAKYSSDRRFLERAGSYANGYFRDMLVADMGTSGKTVETGWVSGICLSLKSNKNLRLGLIVASRLAIRSSPSVSTHLLDQALYTSDQATIDEPSKLLLMPGPGKTGTTSLFRYLLDNYSLRSDELKETDYWDVFRKYGLPVKWYLNHFYLAGQPLQDRGHSIDCSPSSFGCIGEIISELGILQNLLSIKCILTFRDPIERLISIIEHDVGLGLGDADIIIRITDMLDEAETSQHTLDNYLYESRYEINASLWIDTLGRENCYSVQIEQASPEALNTMMDSWGFRRKQSGVTPIPMLNTAQESRKKRTREAIYNCEGVLKRLKSFYFPTYNWLENETRHSYNLTKE